MNRIGVFLCSGCGIGEALKLDDLSAIAAEHKAVSCTVHPCLCAPEGVAAIREAISSGAADGVVLAACSSRAKIEEFRFDTSAVVVDRVSLREQAVWSHPAGDEDTQMLAEDLLRMGLVRAEKSSLPKPLEETVCRTLLVVGGGVAGLEAALAAAGLGHETVLVEKAPALGGYIAGLRDLEPDSAPYTALRPNPVAKTAEDVRTNPLIRILLSSALRSVSGQPGQFQVEVETPSGVETFTAGAIVQATGAKPYDASKLTHLGYGSSADVITSHELDAMLASGRLVRPSNGAAPARVLFVQCAGSRDPQHLRYCSYECCTTTLRQVAAIHRDHPSVETVVLHRDIRTPGQLERFFLAVQELPGSYFTRGEVQDVRGNGDGLHVHVRDSLLGDSVHLDADLIVLAVGMVPNSADGEAIRALHDAERRVEKGETETQREEARKQVAELASHQGSEILNLTYRQGPDLPVLGDAFPDSHFICFPYETRRTGIYAAGALHQPMDVVLAAEDGWGAAMKAVQCIHAASEGVAVHPRSGDRGVPEFFLQRCTQCKRCTEECPFGTLNEDEKGTPQLNALRCRRCGICMGACPERIVSFPDYSVDMVANMIKAINVPDECDEKPRIVALLCENDALPALDAAASLRRQWNPWVRVIPIRCLGSTNIVWIAEALSRGIDGMLLIGCKSGDDYQCHYVRGSQLATTRLGNVQETLTRLALEPERIKVVELAHNEFDRIPQILDDFTAEVEALGANPLKGF